MKPAKQSLKPARILLYWLAALLALGVLLGSAVALGFSVPQRLHPLFWAGLLALMLIAAFDALRLLRLPSPEITRKLPGQLALGRWSEVQLTIQHPLKQEGTLQLFDHTPPGMAFEHLPQSVPLRPGQLSQCRYRLRPLHRGRFTLPVCEVLLPSPMRLWHSRRRLPVEGETRVYPDFARLYGAELIGIERWLGQLGVRLKPRRGLGLEFHQLREFREGDALRQIDWKATARKGSPIAREYQDERDQQVIFLLDCGRRMRSQDGDLAHFDHALNACLLLAYVALRQGDAVGLATFACEQPRFLAPVKGQRQLSALLAVLYDLQSTQKPADFSAAADWLLTRQRRRALVIVASNLRDEDDDELLPAMRRLARYHLVLLASLREEVLDSLRQKPVQTWQDALNYCGTMNYLKQRDRLHQRLAAHGLPLLDTAPQELGPRLVSQYLSWKKAGVF